MAKSRVVIEDFPPEFLLQELKIKAVRREKTSVKALLIGAAEKLLGRKAGKA